MKEYKVLDIRVLGVNESLRDFLVNCYSVPFNSQGKLQ